MKTLLFFITLFSSLVINGQTLKVGTVSLTVLDGVNVKLLIDEVKTNDISRHVYVKRVLKSSTDRNHDITEVTLTDSGYNLTWGAFKGQYELIVTTTIKGKVDVKKGILEII
jgi:hypothetical protein